MTTIQFDFNLPERFDMTYTDSDGQSKRPYMVHRALLGSIERFFGVFIENYAGAFPVWLMPEQAVVIPVAPTFADYADEVASSFRKKGIRIKAMLSDDRMNAKIRDAQNQKIPYMLVVGQREKDEKTVSVRFRDGRQENGVALEACASRILDRIATRSLDL
jgi:threonyl-tRNA synthetase